MCIRPFDPAHFVQDDRYAHIRGLPGGFGASHAAADNVDRFDLAHLGDLRLIPCDVKRKGADWG